MTSNKVLVFDVETTGLIPKYIQKTGKVIASPINVYPYIIQLGFVVYDLKTNKICKLYNRIIRPPDNVFVSPKITEITGITRKQCNEQGVNILDALQEFHDAYMESSTIVSHNLAFDQPMIEVEIHRSYNELKNRGIDGLILFNDLFNKINNKELYCTMKAGKTICNIVVNKEVSETQQKTRNYVKYPKLSELYEKMFSEVPKNLHDAKVDTLLCLRCFMKIKYDTDIDISTYL